MGSSRSVAWHVRLAWSCRVVVRGWVAVLAVRTSRATGRAGVGQLRPRPYSRCVLVHYDAADPTPVSCASQFAIRWS